MDGIELEWTPDCQGKWDYDANILRVSSRYWPRGGGFDVLIGGVWQSPDRSIRPSAQSSIYLGDEVVLESPMFEGDSENEVKVQVEMWVANQLAVYLPAIRNVFRP